MKVWLCAHGSYSDYRVMAVFSDEDRARSVTKARQWNNDPESMELDPEQPEEVKAGLGVWFVLMYDDGGIYNIGPSPHSEKPEADVNFKQLDKSGREFFMWARDREHAIKIANERRIGWLAAGKPA